jgi:lipoprotein NlpI
MLRLIFELLLFVMSTGVLFGPTFRENRLAVLMAGLVGLASFYFLAETVWQRVGAPTSVALIDMSGAPSIAQSLGEQVSLMVGGLKKQLTAPSPSQSAPPRSATDADWQACNDPQFRRIDACSLIIASDNQTPKMRAIAFARRSAYYSNQGILDPAIADMSEAIRYDPTFPNFVYNRGTFYEQKGDLDRAIADISSAIRINPKVSLYYSHRAAIYEKKSLWENALADFRAAVNLDPNNHEATNALARLSR